MTIKSVQLRGSLALTQPGKTLNYLDLNKCISDVVPVDGGGVRTLAAGASKEIILDRSCAMLAVECSLPFRIATDENTTNKTSTFTADSASDALTLITPLNFYSGRRVRLTTTGTLPDPLAVDTDYYVVSRGASTIALATSLNNAVAAAPTAIDITDTGSGTHTITEQDDSYAENVSQFLQTSFIVLLTTNIARLTLVNPNASEIEISVWAYAQRT